MDMDETFSSVECITECMSDPERTRKLIQAIEENVRPGDIVLDAGTGSTILALSAARAGAKKVIALEFDPFVAQLAQKNIDANGFHDVVELKFTDARMLDFEKPIHFDVVIAEMLTTGLVDEHQVWAINNLLQKGYADESTRFIPKRQDTYVELIQKDFVVEGFNMRMLRHIWSWLPDLGAEPLSEKHLLNSVEFNKENPLAFQRELDIVVASSGTLNSIRLTSQTVLGENLTVGDTLALNAPVVFPLEEDLSVTAGETVRIKVAYTFGGGYRNFAAQASIV